MLHSRRRYQQQSFRPRSVRRLEKKARRNLILSIIIILFLVYVIINWGLPALIGSLTVFNKLKPQETRQVVSEDPAIAPPVLNIPFEATNSANLKITGYSASNSQVEIYLDGELKDTVNTREDGSFTVNSIILSQGINAIYGKTVNDQDKKSLASKTIKIDFNDDKPKLEISSPSDGQQIKGGDKKIRVSGSTDPTNTVSVNGSTVIVNGDGNFATDVTINEGDNTITIAAANGYGTITQIQRKISYSP